ncbi:NADH-quinone oxidoreductase subunit L [Mycobacterium tuberculosis]|nr:NADH-quinone oxidoreductase subunit L [Mycobacterium tuberculosis]
MAPLSRKWLPVVGAVALALTFAQSPGQVSPDTKLDLTANPLRFLARATNLWNSDLPFGQAQNQAYGYLFPHGTFFVIGHLLGVPGWVTQRLWWAVLLTVGFWGLLRVAEALGVGGPSSRVVGAVAFALSPRVLTTLGSISSETLPKMLAPWVLLPTILALRGTSGRSVRALAAQAGLAVALMGAVNAIATLAGCLPAVIWWACHRPNRLWWRYTAWWLLAMALATLWWVMALTQLHGVSPPFLDFIESSGVTTQWSSLVEVLRGTDSWTPFVAPNATAGAPLVTGSAAILGTCLVAAAGLAGLTSPAMPARGRLVTMLLAEDPDRRRFFGYLNLFLASMLLLVVADNYVLLYVGWEGVGLASYLLIGFWYHKPSAATAAKKAFVMNRVGDAGLAVGMFLTFSTFGTLSYAGVFAGVPAASRAVLTAIGLLMLLGACAKSAQVPLQAWLGDAMEGPTPVSALIHAATMVTAGVYLIVRSGPLYNLAPTAQLAVVIVGAVTLLFGAIIGCAKDDIKRALAASTISQIGYMVLAAGLGPAGYAFAIMHLLTHGFFKAGLFLGSGAVIHAMHEEQDMRRYGGLRAALPVTFATFGLAYLAIIGVPPFAGFFSKDAIIEAALGAGGIRGSLLGGAALLGAGVTAFYMTRVMLMTFFGEKRWTPGAHPHEAPAVMTWPMILLAVGSVFSGGLLAVGGTLRHWLQPVVGSHEEATHALPTWVATTLALGVVAVGIAVAYRMYGTAPIPRVAPVRVSALTAAARADLYGDAFNEEVFMRPGAQLTNAVVAVDDAGVDGSVNALATLVSQTSNRLRQMQTGFARNYALSMLVGAVLVAAALLVVQLW